jgi:hypothetical protein
MTIEAAGKIEFEKNELDAAAGPTGQANDLVDRNRRGAQQLFDKAAKVIVRVIRFKWGRMEGNGG